MSSLYDLTEIREMSGDDADFLKEMVELFVKNNTQYLVELNDALKIKNWSQVKFFAHKIKPSILVVHADGLKQTILDLNEFAGKEINLDQVPSLIEKLNDQLPVLCEALKKEIK